MTALFKTHDCLKKERLKLLLKNITASSLRCFPGWLWSSEVSTTLVYFLAKEVYYFDHEVLIMIDYVD